MALRFAFLDSRRGRTDFRDECLRRLASIGLLPEEQLAPGATPKDDLDFILWFDAGEPPAALGARARHGVWFFRFGDGEQHGEAPPAFWEVYDAAPVTGARLMRMTGAGTFVTRRGWIATQQRSWRGTRDALASECAMWPMYACLSLQRGIDLPRDAGAAGPPVRRVRPWHVAILAAKVMARRIAAGAEWFYVHEWNVGLVDTPAHALLDGKLTAVRWYPSVRPNFFIADPFGIESAGKKYVFVELFDVHKNIGTIAYIPLSGDGWTSSIGPALKTGVHASYPFLVQDGGETYCIPEVCAGGSVDLYRATAFPASWEKVCSLAPDLGGVDSTALRYAERWWLFYGDHDDGAMYKLNVMYADSLDGPWTRHPANPVKIDARGSRGAGPIFSFGGSMYRPAQDCSQSYGGAVTLNRILELSTTVYREEAVATVTPRPGDAYVGVHTVSAFGQMTVIDGKRRRFTLRKIRNSFVRSLKRALGRREKQHLE